MSLPIETWEDVRLFFDAYSLESRRPVGERPSRLDRLKRMRRFLTLLGDPQNQLKVVHVAGTTGKGSTCTFIEALLRAQGFSTGLTVSPHAIDLRERFQVNGAYPADGLLIQIVKRLVQAVQRMQKEPCGVPGYIEFLIATAYSLCTEARVQYAIIETGVGGRTDPSNMVMRADKLCVFTKLGHDHTDVLGERLEDIAYQKVGIVQTGNEVVIGRQDEFAIEKFAALAQGAGAGTVTRLDPFVESPVTLSQITPYLRENAELAVFTCRRLALRDGWVFDESLAQSALQHVSIPLRFEIVNWKGKTLILDAAHNAQKMAGLVEALKLRFPRHTLAAVIALNTGIEVKTTLAPLLPCISYLACADLIVGRGAYRFRFSDPHEMVARIRAMHPRLATQQEIEVLPDQAALFAWLERVPESMIVCTGSFHFVAVLRALVLGLPEPW